MLVLRGLLMAISPVLGISITYAKWVPYEPREKTVIVLNLRPYK
jgi:hypothetical protein